MYEYVNILYVYSNDWHVRCIDIHTHIYSILCRNFVGELNYSINFLFIK